MFKSRRQTVMRVLRLLNLLSVNVAAIALAAICSSAASLAQSSLSASDLAIVTPKPASAVDPSPIILAQKDAFSEGIKSATRAVNLTQNASSSEDWNEIAVAWLEAATWMQAVPPGSSKRALAQKKVSEYLRNFAIAQQKTAETEAQLPFPTFNSDILDEQLRLYLSYLSAFGPPDILIVGSSRALQGIDPRVLQQALSARGYPGLRVFNFSVNGATARVVDFKLRELLSVQQLPRLILWADGVRAFNSGRADRTYEAIASSPGYQNLLAGIRPRLRSAAFSPSSQPNPLTAVALGTGLQCDRESAAGTNLSSPLSLNSSKTLKRPFPYRDIFTQSTPPFSPFQGSSESASIEANFSEKLAINYIFYQAENTIDANGFLSVSTRFNPANYYRRNARISGRYDGDYANFQLGGNQAAALNSLIKFAKNRKIPLIFVNLPLTQDYLDSARKSAEQQFVQYMYSKARELGFIFRNLSQGNFTQNSYFADPSHINLYGAAAVSRYLAQDRTISWPKPR